MMKVFLTVFATAAALMLTAGNVLNPVMRLNDAARLDIYNRESGITGLFEADKFTKNDDWVKLDFCDVSDNAANTVAADSLTRSGSFKDAKTNVLSRYTMTAVPAGMDAVTLKITVTPENPEALKEIFWSLRLNYPLLGREIKFRLNDDKQKTYYDQKTIAVGQNGGWVWSSPAGHTAESIDIPLRFGTLRLDGFKSPVMICKYGERVGNLRLVLPVIDGKVAAEITARFIPYQITPLNLAAANVGFADAVANDGKGGWTDQGPDNDFAMMPLGAQMFGNVKFTVIDPAQNNGKSVLAFRNPARPDYLAAAELTADGQTYAWLYLFHAAAWCNRKAVGTIEVIYVDNTKSLFEVTDRRDVGNWWEPAGAVNAAVVYQGKNPSSVIGMYLSRFALARKGVKSVKLVSADNSVWLVAGASLVRESNIPFPALEDVQERPYTLNAADYREFTFDKNPVKGSALDFSWLLDAPAGKYGPVVIKGENFEFALRPGRPVRFLGVSICEEMNFLEHADSQILADRIAACGYNAVRFHHFDGFLVKPEATTPELESGMLDKLHYLFAALKKRGIYLTLDLYTMRNNGFSQKYKGMFDVKSRMMFDPEMRQNVLDFARNLLLAVNPYTGLSMADDPALISVGIINEDPLFTHHEEYKYPNRDPLQQANMTSAYRAWCERNHLEYQELPSDNEWMRFMLDHQRDVFMEMKNALRQMGVKQPLSDLSCTSLYATALPRSEYDYVDNHSYFDHPEFPGVMFQPPYLSHNKSVIAAKFPVPLQAGSVRLFGKPFMLTEFNFCVPNDKRSEAGPVIGAMAAMQNWSGIFRFDFGSYQRSWKIDPVGNGGQLGVFNAANDPVMQLTERITALFYLRGDVAVLPESRVLTVTPAVWQLPAAAGYANWAKRRSSEVPENFTKLGLLYRTGMAVTGNVPANGMPVENALKGEPLVDLSRPVKSPTGEFIADCEAGTLKVITPRSEALVIPAGRPLAGKRLKVSSNAVFATVFAGALDDAELSASGRVLILHLTDVKASGQRLALLGSQMMMYNLGKPSLYLMRRGASVIELASQAAGTATLRALDINGRDLGPVEFVRCDGNIVFTADPGATGAFAYELRVK